MTSQVSRRLSSVSNEIASLRADLSRLLERLEVQRSVLDEYRLRMLIAETPLADRDLHTAAESFLALEEEVRAARGRLDALLLEERALGLGLAAAGA